MTALGLLSCGLVGLLQHINDDRHERILWGNDLPTFIPRTRFPNAWTRTREVDHCKDDIG